MIRIKNIRIVLIILLIFSLVSCEDKIPERLNFPDYSMSEYLYKVMIEEQWYLWVDEVEYVDPKDYKFSPDLYLDKIIYKELDKWSYIEDIATHDAYFESGEIAAFGFSYKYDENNNMRISLVLKDSPIDRAGIKRGYKIISINNTPVVNLTNDQIREKLGPSSVGYPADFQFEDHNGNKIIRSLTKELVTEHAVHFDTIVNISNNKIGYFVFNSFIQPAYDELDELFLQFKNEHIDELIIDLRYNGGGSVDVANYLGNLIAGGIANGKIYNTLEYNEYKTEFNENLYFDIENNSLNIDRVFFITTRGSASASELLINSLKPFIEVILIGDNTHGKPVGMRTFRYKDMVAAFITFKSVNADDEGDYFEGLPVDAPTRDGLEKEFGDPEEDCLKQAYYFIENGSFIPSLKSKPVSPELNEFPRNGFEMMVGLY